MSKLKLIIQINGLKRSGKDYTAEIMKEILGDRLSSVSYAAPMKRIIATTLGITLEELEDFKNNDTRIKTQESNGYEQELNNARKVLQQFGTEAMKVEFGEDVWADKGRNDAINSGSEIVVIPDFRFVSENKRAVAFADDLGYKVVTINIFNNDLPPADLHASERDLSDNNFVFDYSLDNTGQPTDLKMHIEAIITQVTASL